MLGVNIFSDKSHVIFDWILCPNLFIFIFDHQQHGTFKVWYIILITCVMLKCMLEFFGNLHYSEICALVLCLHFNKQLSYTTYFWFENCHVIILLQKIIKFNTLSCIPNFGMAIGEEWDEGAYMKKKWCILSKL